MARVYIGPLGSYSEVEGTQAGNAGRYAVRPVFADTTMQPGESIMTGIVSVPLVVPVNVTLPVITPANLGARLQIVNLQGAGIFEFNIIAPVSIPDDNPGLVLIIRPVPSGGASFLFNFQDSIVLVAQEVAFDFPIFPFPNPAFAWIQE
jgi:hypothetical protein